MNRNTYLASKAWSRRDSIAASTRASAASVAARTAGDRWWLGSVSNPARAAVSASFSGDGAYS